MSSEVVVPVDWVGRLLAVLADNHGSEVAGEELIVGPQVESEMPVDTRRRCSQIKDFKMAQSCMDGRRHLTFAGR